MAATGASLVVNGSYYAHDATPDTPVVSDGHRLGPASYQATHGAFVVGGPGGPDGARLVDLAGLDWRRVTDGASQAMVSYPMLLGADGHGRTDGADERWLANRSFLGQDGAGRIIVGTTRDAYFSLPSLAAFLPRAGLDLRLALNLDGTVEHRRHLADELVVLSRITLAKQVRHPRRGRSALRPGNHHLFRPNRAARDAGRVAPAVSYLGVGASGSPAGRTGRAAGGLRRQPRRRRGELHGRQ